MALSGSSRSVVAETPHLPFVKRTWPGLQEKLTASPLGSWLSAPSATLLISHVVKAADLKLKHRFALLVNAYLETYNLGGA